MSSTSSSSSSIALEIVSCRHLRVPADTYLAAYELVHASVRIIKHSNNYESNNNNNHSDFANERTTRRVPRNPTKGGTGTNKLICNPQFAVYKKETFAIAKHNNTFQWTDCCSDHGHDQEGEGCDAVEISVWGTSAPEISSDVNNATTTAERWRKLVNSVLHKTRAARKPRFLGRVRLLLDPLLEERLEVLPSIFEDNTNIRGNAVSDDDDSNDNSCNRITDETPKSTATSTSPWSGGADNELIWIDLQRSSRKDVISGSVGIRIHIKEKNHDELPSGMPSLRLSTCRSVGSSVGNGGGHTERRLFHDRHLVVLMERASIRVTVEDGKHYPRIMERVMGQYARLLSAALGDENSMRLYGFARLGETRARTQARHTQRKQDANVTTIPEEKAVESSPQVPSQQQPNTTRGILDSVAMATEATKNRLRDLLAMQQPKSNRDITTHVFGCAWDEAFVLEAGAKSHAGSLSLALFDASETAAAASNSATLANRRQVRGGRTNLNLQEFEEGAEEAAGGGARMGRRPPPQHHCLGHVHIPLSWLDVNPNTRFQRSLFTGNEAFECLREATSVEEAREQILREKIDRCSRWIKLDTSAAGLNAAFAAFGRKPPKIATWVKVSAFFCTKQDAMQAAKLRTRNGFASPVAACVAVEEPLRILRICLWGAELNNTNKKSCEKEDTEDASGVVSNGIGSATDGDGDGWGMELLRRANARQDAEDFVAPKPTTATSEMVLPDPFCVLMLKDVPSGPLGFGVACGARSMEFGAGELCEDECMDRRLHGNIIRTAGLCPRVPRTHVAPRTYNPRWNSSMAMLVPTAETLVGAVELQVLDAKRKKKKMLEDDDVEEDAEVEDAEEEDDDEDIGDDELDDEDDEDILSSTSGTPRSSGNVSNLWGSCKSCAGVFDSMKKRQRLLHKSSASRLATVNLPLKTIPSLQHGGSSVTYRWVDSTDGRHRVRLAAYWEEPSIPNNDDGMSVLGMGTLEVMKVQLIEPSLASCRRPVFVVASLGEHWLQTHDANAREEQQQEDAEDAEEEEGGDRSSYLSQFFAKIEELASNLPLPKYASPLAASVAAYVGRRIRPAIGPKTHRRMARDRRRQRQKNTEEVASYLFRGVPGGWSWKVTDPADAVYASVFERRSHRAPLLLGRVCVRVSSLGRNGANLLKLPLTVEAESGRRVVVGHLHLSVGIRWDVSAHRVLGTYLRAPTGVFGHAPIGLGERPACLAAPGLSWTERVVLRRLRMSALAATLVRSARAVHVDHLKGQSGMILPECVCAAMGGDTSFSVRAIKAHIHRLVHALTGGMLALVAMMPELDIAAIVGWQNSWVSSCICFGWMLFVFHARHVVGIVLCVGALIAGVGLAHARPLSWVACKEVGPEEVQPSSRVGFAATLRAADVARRQLRHRKRELLLVLLAAQHAMHDSAVWAERIRALVCFADRRASTLFFCVLVLAGAVIVAVPLRWLALFVGLFIMRPPSLRAYGVTPPPLNLLLRLPSLEDAIL